MKIYFSCNGLGLGHVGRSLAIANELKAQGHEVFFGTWGPAVNYARKEEYRCYSLPDLEWADNPDGSFDIVKTVLKFPKILYLLIKAVVFERHILMKEKPDFVFSDVGTGHIAARREHIPSNFITHQISLPHASKAESFLFETIMYFLASFADRLLVNDFKRPNNIYPASISRYSKTTYIGPLVRNRPTSYPSKEALKRKLKIKSKKLCFIIISGPKHSPYALEKRIFDIESKLLEMKEWHFIIRSWSFRESRKNITYMTWIDDMFEIMKASDIIVSRAGYSTVCDIVCFGKKSILIPQPKQFEQEALGDYLQWKGLAYNISQKETYKIPELVKKLDEDKTMEKNIEPYMSMFLNTDLGALAEKIVSGGLYHH